MGEIDGIVEKVKARNTKESTSPTKIFNAALEYLKGTRLYKDSTDVQREKMIRELRKRFGQKEEEDLKESYEQSKRNRAERDHDE